MSTCILWFRNNLRLGDNAPVLQAYNTFETVIPVYFIPTADQIDSWGNPTIGAMAGTILTRCRHGFT